MKPDLWPYISLPLVSPTYTKSTWLHYSLKKILADLPIYIIKTPVKYIFLSWITFELIICDKNFEGLEVFGFTFGNSTMMLRVIKFRIVM